MGRPVPAAFRFAAERELLPLARRAPGSWSAKLERSQQMTFAEVMAASGDRAHVPTSIQRGLRALWFTLLQKRAEQGGDVLDELFGHSPQTGLAKGAQLR